MKYAVLNKLGQVLKIQSSNPLDWGIIPEVTTETLGYFPLSAGDGVLMSKAQRLFLIFCLKSEGTGIYFSCASREVDLNGPFPPTPIMAKGKIQTQMLQAICAHFSSCENLEKEISYLQSSAEKFLQNQDLWGLANTQAVSKKAFKSVISELPHHEVRIEQENQFGDVVKLKLSLSDAGFLLDFAGTSSSQNLGLTEFGTKGTIENCIARFLGLQDLACAELFSMIQVVTPSQSFLNGKHSDFVTAQFLEVAVYKALSKLVPKKAKESLNPLSVRLNAKWEGTAERMSLNIHARAPLEFSIQEIEAKYPVLFKSISKTDNLVMEFELLKPGKVDFKHVHIKNSWQNPQVTVLNQTVTVVLPLSEVKA